MIASLTIYVRSCFRVAELWGGFHSALANNELVFMLLEGAMLLTATTCQTVFHPHFAFRGNWHNANFSMRKDKTIRKQHSNGFELMGKSNASTESVVPMMV